MDFGHSPMPSLFFLFQEIYASLFPSGPTQPPRSCRAGDYYPKKADVWAATAIIYIVATGRMPFDERKSTVSIARDMKRLQVWNFHKLNDPFASLMRFGFTFDFEERPTLKELRAHPWFNGPTQVVIFPRKTGENRLRRRRTKNPHFQIRHIRHCLNFLLGIQHNCNSQNRTKIKLPNSKQTLSTSNFKHTAEVSD